MSKLRVFEGEVDHVVAESAEDAAEIGLTELSYDRLPEGEGGHPAHWTEVDPEKVITITMNPGYHDENKIMKTASQWAQESGRGLLCSTEF